MLQPGDPAPEFQLPDQDGILVRLSELLASGPVLLYFYPADFTPGCTAQACSFRELDPALREAGIQLVGISPQNPESHQRFRGQYGLPFRLLADADKAVIKHYGCDGPLGIGVRRITYLIGQDGRIQDALKADFRIGRHTEFVRRAGRQRQ